MRKLFSLSIAIVLFGSFLNNAHASESLAEQWFAPYDKTRGDLVGFNFSEGFEFQRLTTHLSPDYPSGTQVISADGKLSLIHI